MNPTPPQTQASQFGSGFVLLARLVRPQGRKGELIAELFTDFPERFAKRPRIFLLSPNASLRNATEPRPMVVERHWLHQGRVVLKFEGIDSINEAEALRGLDVVVPVEERVPLEDDAVYIGDLIGCSVVDVAEGAEVLVGTIEDVERAQGGAADLLVVRPSAPAASIRIEAADETSALKPRRGRRAKKAPELLIPFAKRYVVAVEIGLKRVVMQLPPGLVDLNVGSDVDPDADRVVDEAADPDAGEDA